MDLNAYFSRIGYSGPCEPTLDVLRGIQFAHATTIPFENLDILLGRGVSLDDDAIERKLIHQGRGGYCFEQNSLLLRVLIELGFQVTPLSARVRLGFTREQTPPRTHLFLRVDLDDIPWLVDVGIGGFSPTGPIRLDSFDQVQTTPHEPRRIVCETRLPFPMYFHQVRSSEEWLDVCDFSGEEMPLIDRQLANWWTSAQPQSRFQLNLIVSLAHRDGTRISIFNREYLHRRSGDVLERIELGDPDQLLALLSERFGLHFAAGTRFSQPHW